MKDKVPFYHIVNMFFLGAIFALCVFVICPDIFPIDYIRDNNELLSKWTFLISAVLIVAMYEIGFVINKMGAIIISPIMIKLKIWPRDEYHIDVSEISQTNDKFQSMITELVLLRSHIMMNLILSGISVISGKISYLIILFVLIAVFIFAGKKHNNRINTIRKEYVVNTGPRAPRARDSSATLPETSTTEGKAV